MKVTGKGKAAACAALGIVAVTVVVVVWHPWAPGTSAGQSSKTADVSPIEALDEGAPLDDPDKAGPEAPAEETGSPVESPETPEIPDASASAASEILADGSLRSSGSGMTVMADTDVDASAEETEAVKARLAELQAACAAVEVGTEATDASRAVVTEYTYPDSSNAAKGVLLGDLFGGNATVDMGSVVCKKDPDGDGWSQKVAFKLTTNDGQTVAIDGYYVPATKMFKVSNWAVAA